MAKAKKAVAKTRRKPKAKSLKPKALPIDVPGSRIGTQGLLILPQKQAGVHVTEYTSLTLGAFWACVQCISEDLAKLPWGVFKKLASGGRKPLPTDQNEWLLQTQANPETSAQTFRETILGHALVWGNGFAEIERDGAGRPYWLWQITPDRVIVTRDSRGNIVYDVRNPREPNTVLSADDVFHLKGLGFDGLVGYSVVHLATRSVGLGISLEEQASNFASNDSTPGGVLEHPGKLKEAAAANLRDSWNRVHAGPKKRRSVAVLEEGMTWHQTGLPPEDSQMIQQRQATPAEMCRWFRVPPHKIADLLRATFCVPGDAAIFTEHGPRSAAEIKKGDRVWSRSQDNQWVLSNVAHAACTGVREVLEIRAGIRTLRCTANHRVPIRRQVLTPFASGRGRSVMVDGQRYRNTWETKWVEAGEIKPGDRLLAANGLGDSGVRSCPTRDECSVEFMESLGMIVGDGFFIKSRGYNTGFGISHGESDSYLPHYVAAMEAEFQAYSGPYGKRNGLTIPVKSSRRDKNTTVFHSGHAYDELEACSIVGTAKTKCLPGWIFCLADELKIAFLRGYLDADGTVTKKGQIRYVSVNRPLLDQVRHLCMSVGVRCGKLSFSELDSNFNGKKYSHVLWSFVCTDAKDNARIGTHTDFYEERIRNRISSRQKRTSKVYPCEARQREKEDGLIFTLVESVRTMPPAPVYDLSVEETNTFICDGIYVHNSNIEEQNIEYVGDALMPWARRLESEADLKLFGPINRGLLFTRLDFRALLRGNITALGSFYNSMLDRGVYCINDVLDREDMNPIGPDGDKRFVPLNMQLLDKAGEEPPPPKVPPPPAPAKPGADANKPSTGADKAPTGAPPKAPLSPETILRPAIEDACGRVVRSEMLEAQKIRKRWAAVGEQRAAFSKFLGKHTDYVRAVLMPTILGLLSEDAALIVIGVFAPEYERDAETRFEAGPEIDAQTLAACYAVRIIGHAIMARAAKENHEAGTG